MTIETWLRDLGLERYADAFREADVDLDVLPDLTERDLERLGVTLGHRKKLLRAILRLDQEAAAPETAPAVAEFDRTDNAERRHLTVLFCDLVGSTELAARLDPEDMAAVYQAYSACCRNVLTRWEGHLDHFAGDGAFAFFGYPQAHEDDAVRAAHAALDLVSEIRDLRVEGSGSRGLSARIGIASGLVLASRLDLRDGRVVGDTVNLAARLQTLAEPQQVLVNAATRRLLGGAFKTTTIGRRPLKGFREPVEIWRLDAAATRSGSRLHERAIGRLAPFIGREGEMAALGRLWDETCAGGGQVVLLSGEAGIGKSRIAHEFTARIAEEPHAFVDLHGSPYHTSSAWRPVIDWIERAAGLENGLDDDVRRARLETLLESDGWDRDSSLPLIARLMSMEGGATPPLPDLPPTIIRERTIAALRGRLEMLATRRPLLLLVEDAHWLDPSSRDFLEAVAERMPEMRAMMLLTTRPEGMESWRDRPHFTRLDIGRLDRGAASELVQGLLGRAGKLAALARNLVAKADGVPLFLEELTLAAAGDDGDDEVGVPDTLKDLLTARLDRLGPAKDVAQMASIIGREFGRDLLEKSMGLSTTRLDDALGVLVEAELVFESGGSAARRYVFKHALVRDAAYDSLLKSRRKALHSRIAEVIEVDYPALAESQPELLAQHYAGAANPELACDAWLRAGRRAVARSAMVEAVEHLRQGLRQLGKTKPGAERGRRELDLLRALAPALLVTRGYATEETRTAFERLRELCEALSDVGELFTALRGLWAFRFVRADLHAAAELAQRLAELAGEDNALRIEAYRAIGMTALYRGDFASAALHLERGAELYDADRHHVHAERYGNDPGVVCLSYGAKALWCLGRVEEAEARSHKALSLSEALDHPFSRSQALSLAAMLAQHRRRIGELSEAASAAIASASAYSFAYWTATASILAAWSRSQSAPSSEAVAALEAALDDYRASGAELAVPWFLALAAEARGRIGDREGALDRLREAEARCDATDERYYLAEILRLRGELLWETQPEAAEAAIRAAIARAEAQEARPYARRARLSLARRLAAGGRIEEARQTLGPVTDEAEPGEEAAEIEATLAFVDAAR